MIKKIFAINYHKPYEDGIFNISIADFYFPDKDWFDLPLSILVMWSQNIIKSYKRKISYFYLYFMEGPYHVLCIRLFNKLILLFSYTPKNRSRIQKIELITTDDLLNEVVRVNKKLIEEMFDLVPHNKKFDEIESCQRQLLSMIKN